MYVTNENWRFHLQVARRIFLLGLRVWLRIRVKAKLSLFLGLGLELGIGLELDLSLLFGF